MWLIEFSLLSISKNKLIIESLLNFFHSHGELQTIIYDRIGRLWPHPAIRVQIEHTCHSIHFTLSFLQRTYVRDILTMSKFLTKRISVTLPQETLERLNRFIPLLERSAIVTDLIEEYLDELEAEFEREAQIEQRRQQRLSWFNKLRTSGQKAADLFLP